MPLAVEDPVAGDHAFGGERVGRGRSAHEGDEQQRDARDQDDRPDEGVREGRPFGGEEVRSQGAEGDEEDLCEDAGGGSL